MARAGCAFSGAQPASASFSSVPLELTGNLIASRMTSGGRLTRGKQNAKRVEGTPPHSVFPDGSLNTRKGLGELGLIHGRNGLDIRFQR